MAAPPSYLRGLFELTRLHKPLMGNTLLFWPFAWGFTIAARAIAFPVPEYAAILAGLALASLVLHSSLCVLNDICDVEFDKQVARTKMRPLACGAVSLWSAWTLCIALALPVFVLLSFGNRLTFALGVPSFLVLHGLYPLMKRWTWWPQAWLGLGFNWGIPFAWIVLTGDWPPAPLWVFYAGAICWSIVYDTIYACQDREDDRRVGVKSTALLFGAHVRPILMAHAAAFFLAEVWTARALGLGPGFTVLSCGGTLLQLSWQLLAWDEREMRDHRNKFESNGLLGSVIWLGLLYDYLVAAGVDLGALLPLGRVLPVVSAAGSA